MRVIFMLLEHADFVKKAFVLKTDYNIMNKAVQNVHSPNIILDQQAVKKLNASIVKKKSQKSKLKRDKDSAKNALTNLIWEKSTVLKKMILHKQDRMKIMNKIKKEIMIHQKSM
jgi:hypothetical protein